MLFAGVQWHIEGPQFPDEAHTFGVHRQRCVDLRARVSDVATRDTKEVPVRQRLFRMSVNPQRRLDRRRRFRTCFPPSDSKGARSIDGGGSCLPKLLTGKTEAGFLGIEVRKELLSPISRAPLTRRSANEGRAQHFTGTVCVIKGTFHTGTAEQHVLVPDMTLEQPARRPGSSGCGSRGNTGSPQYHLRHQQDTEHTAVQNDHRLLPIHPFDYLRVPEHEIQASRFSASGRKCPSSPGKAEACRSCQPMHVLSFGEGR